MRHVSSSTKALSSPTTIWNRAFISIFIANGMMYLGMQMVNTLVAKYANSLGASGTVVGLVSSIYALSALCMKVISGPAIDSFDRRHILMGAMFIMGLSYFGLSVSHTVPMLLLFRIMQGFGQAFSATCCLAIASDALPTEKLSSGIGIFSMALAACQAIGPTVALSLYSRIGYNLTFAVSAICMMLAVFTTSFVHVPNNRRKAFRISLNSIIAIECILPSLLQLLLSMAFAVINAFLVIYAAEIEIENIGYFFTVYAGSMLISRPLIGKLTDKFGLVYVLIPATICFAVSFYLISISTNLWMLLIAAFISAFGYGASQPAVQSLCMKCVPSKRRGAASSTNYIGNDLGVLLGPVIGGYVVDIFGYSAMWRIMLIPVFIAMVLVIMFRRKIQIIEATFEAGFPDEQICLNEEKGVNYENFSNCWFKIPNVF